MLPCQSKCPSYREGCHKTCPQWRQFQAEQQAQRQAKKEYLQFHNALSGPAAKNRGAAFSRAS